MKAKDIFRTDAVEATASRICENPAPAGAGSLHRFSSRLLASFRTILTVMLLALVVFNACEPKEGDIDNPKDPDMKQEGIVIVDGVLDVEYTETHPGSKEVIKCSAGVKLGIMYTWLTAFNNQDYIDAVKKEYAKHPETAAFPPMTHLAIGGAYDISDDAKEYELMMLQAAAEAGGLAEYLNMKRTPVEVSYNLTYDCGSRSMKVNSSEDMTPTDASNIVGKSSCIAWINIIYRTPGVFDYKLLYNIAGGGRMKEVDCDGGVKYEDAWEGVSWSCSDTEEEEERWETSPWEIGYDLNRADFEKFLKDPTQPFSIDIEDSFVYEDSKETLKGTLTFNGALPEVDAWILPPPDYEEWLPEAGESEATRGNDITFKVSLCKRGDEETLPPQTARFRFELIDVSEEKGTCVNWPVYGTTERDLKIRQEDNPDLSVKSDVLAETKTNKVQKAEIRLRNFDWGTHAKLRVTALIDDGKDTPVTAHVYLDKGKKEVTIPLDDDGDYIADAWEKREGVLSYGGDWDFDPTPTGQRETGDGYSNYEEYRGFRTTTKDHVRTDPKAKDLFVYDADGLVDKYFGHPESAGNAAELMLHFLTKEHFMVWERKVNVNSTTYKNADQYLVYVIDDKVYNDDNKEAAGYADGAHEGFDDGQFLKTCKSVNINRSGITAYCTNTLKNPGLTENYIKKTTIHEIGHALSIPHHQLAQIDGGTTDEPEIGVQSCYMRYQTFKEEKAGGAQTHFCREGETWLWTTPIGTVYSRPADNCWGKINVKMKK
jgi:hypothetical protein